MELLNTKAAQIVAGVLSLGILTIGGLVWLHYGGYLAWLTAVEITVLVLLGNLALTVGILRWHRAPVVVRDKAGAPARVVDGQVLAHPIYPASLTSLTTHYDPRISAPAAALPAPVVEATPLPRAEPFYRIVRSLSQDRLILGYNLAGPIYGRMDDLLSTAIIGRPGTGKTTALRFITATVLRIGGQVAIMDPHASIGAEVANALDDYATDAAEMHRLAGYLDEQLGRRLALLRQGKSFDPLLLIADEWPVISHLSATAVDVAGKIVLEGRKVRMFALISGQGLPSDQLGGSLVRDALSSRYVFNTTALQARMAGLDNDTAKRLLMQLDTAGPGYAILASAARKAEIIAVPNTTPEELQHFAEGLGGLPPLPEVPPLPPNPSLSLQQQAQNTPKSAADEERERILDVLDEHPDWSNARVAAHLGMRNNNKISLIKALREETHELA